MSLLPRFPFLDTVHLAAMDVFSVVFLSPFNTTTRQVLSAIFSSIAIAKSHSLHHLSPFTLLRTMASFKTSFPSGPPDLKHVDGFKIESQINQGTCGVVYLARSRDGTTLRAIKIFRSCDRLGRGISRSRQIEAIKYQCVASDSDVQKKMDSVGNLLQPPTEYYPNIVRPLHIRTKRPSCISMQYYQSGDLYQNVNKGEFKGNDERIKRIFLQVVRAVQHCHTKSIYVGDIKPENMLLSDDKNDAFLADFGHCITDKDSKLSGWGTEVWRSPGKSPSISSS